MTIPLTSGIQFLAKAGLNLCAIFDTAALPKSIQTAFANAEIDAAAYERLVLLGNAGNSLWEPLQAYGMTDPDPIDRYSKAMAQQFIDQFVGDVPHLHLYPNGPLIPLQQLGKLAGWHHDSPLGLGIHSKYGVWFAYRAALLIDAPLPLMQDELGPSPCDSCADKPCISSCPVGAVGEIGRFQIPTCATHRIQPNSPCADRCLSRLACPVAPEHRYPLAQVQYHYAQSLDTLHAWFGK